MVDPTAVAGVPSASSWYMNPFFAASFGAAAALGLILLGLSYIIFVRLRSRPFGTNEEPRCSTCGMTPEMLATFNCRAHEATQVRVKACEEWMRDQRDDINRLRERVDAIERRGGYGRPREDY